MCPVELRQDSSATGAVRRPKPRFQRLWVGGRPDCGEYVQMDEMLLAPGGSEPMPVQIEEKTPKRYDADQGDLYVYGVVHYLDALINSISPGFASCLQFRLEERQEWRLSFIGAAHHLQSCNVISVLRYYAHETVDTGYSFGYLPLPALPQAATQDR